MSEVPPASRNRVCLWYEGEAEDAANFYAETFSETLVTDVIRASGDYPPSEQGE